VRGEIGESDFFLYNNYKNHIINNKSDKNKILNLRMATSLPVARRKHTTASCVFTETRQ
jgi:hypothetical protein